MNSNQSDGAPRSPLLDAFPVPDFEQWRAEVERLLKGAPYAKKMFTRTLEGITVGPMYTAQDTAALPWTENYPGQSPFLRGTRAQGHLPGGWLVAQDLLAPTVEEFNTAIRHDLERGQQAVCLRLDQAGQLGLDPDQAEPGTVGLAGTSVASVSELAVALQGVDLKVTPLCLQPGASALPMAALLVALLKQQGTDPSALRGSLGSDPVYGLVSLGALPVDLEVLLDELAVLTRWAVDNAPGMTTLPVYELPWHQGGADSALSLGLTLATAVHALRAMESRGIALEDAAARLRFRMVVGADFFMEIAKLRAVRLLWADILSAAGCSATSGRASVHAQTSTRGYSVLDPHVNLLRAVTMAMSAVLGGADSLHVSPFDEMDSLPDEFSRRIARNVQLILREECHFGQVADPAGGSWYVEKLTADLAARAWNEFQEIEAAGGIVAGLKSGLVQEKVGRAADERRSRLGTGGSVLVGTTRYANPLEPERQPRQPDLAELHARRAKAMGKLRTAAAHEDHLIVLKRLEKILSSGPGDLFESLVEAAAQGATLGEMTGILRHDADRNLQVRPIAPRRDAVPFEEIHRTIRAALRRGAPEGRVFCACLGDSAGYLPRLEFVRGFFLTGGCEVQSDGFFTTATEAADAAAAAGAGTVVLVGLDETYPTLAAATARLIKKNAPQARLLLAGQPGPLEQELRDAGVEDFIHIRSNVLDILGEIARNAEVES